MGDITTLKLTMDDVFHIAKSLGWNVSVDGSVHTFTKRIGEGPDFSIATASETPEDIIRELDKLWEGFDPSKEAYLWVDRIKPSVNGTSYDVTNIFREMLGYKDLVANLHYALVNFGNDIPDAVKEPVKPGEWVRVIDKLPEHDQQVLAYWHESGDVHQYHLLTYFKKGQEMDRIVSHTYGNFAENLLDTLFNDENMLRAPEDGFYFYDCSGEMCTFKKHSSVITHWMIPPEPPIKEGSDENGKV